MNVEELEKAYQDCVKGEEKPSYVWVSPPHRLRCLTDIELSALAFGLDDRLDRLGTCPCYHGGDADECICELQSEYAAAILAVYEEQAKREGENKNGPRLKVQEEEERDV